MKYYSHRGCLTGPNPSRENHPEFIDEAIKRKFDVEIDVWLIKKKIFLGHDNPQYEIKLSFLIERINSIICHAKNVEILPLLLENNIHCFFHNTDDAVLTSKNFVWTFPGKKHVKNSIAVVPERVGNKIDGRENIVGICSDYILEWRELL